MRKKLVVVSLAIVVLAVSIGTFYRFLFLHFVCVPTSSMANTVIAGDCLVVRKRAFGAINRGDLIVFRYSEDLDTYYIARVVGLPGETLTMRNKMVYAGEQELMEERVTVKGDPYAEILEELSSEGTGKYRVFYEDQRDLTRQEDPSGPFSIPSNEYFVMGDNRDNSRDSRYRSSVPRELIFGKPFMIYVSHSPSGGTRWERTFSWLQ